MAKKESKSKSIPLSKIAVNKSILSRTDVDQNRIEECVESIRTHGIIQPIAVRQRGDSYEIIDGLHRYVAAKESNLSKMPVMVKDVGDDIDALAMSFEANMRRKNLKAWEECENIARLVSEKGRKWVIEECGRTKGWVSQRLKAHKLFNRLNSDDVPKENWPNSVIKAYNLILAEESIERSEKNEEKKKKEKSELRKRSKDLSKRETETAKKRLEEGKTLRKSLNDAVIKERSKITSRKRPKRPSEKIEYGYTGEDWLCKCNALYKLYHGKKDKHKIELIREGDKDTPD